MAFSKITKSSFFKKMYNSLDGRTHILRAKRFVFNSLYLIIDDVNWQKINYRKTYNKKVS